MKEGKEQRKEAKEEGGRWVKVQVLRVSFMRHCARNGVWGGGGGRGV
jgi:hypothetical protein